MNTTSNALPSPVPDAEPQTNPNDATTPPLTVVPDAEKSVQPRSLLNQAQLRELALAQDVATAAQKPAYADLLTTRKIDPPFVAKLVEDILTAHKLNTAVLASDVGGQKATQKSAECEAKLVGSLRRIQTAARQEYLHEDPLKLKEYLVGEEINISRPVLEQSSHTLLDKAAAERPAGLDTTFIQQVEGQRTDYVNCDALQAGEVSDAQQERAKRQAMIDSIKQRRQKIQFAAEFLWPSTDPAHAALRREFRLPAERPYLG